MPIPKIAALFIWTVFFTIMFLVLFNGIKKKNQLLNNPKYVSGTITGTSEGAKGNRYVNYKYKVDGMFYSGHVSVVFCNQCVNHCCVIGAYVKVRYAADNPSNSDLIH